MAVVHVVAADLDGDGADETVTGAETGMDEPVAAHPAGSYALVIVRRPDGGDVVTSRLSNIVFEQDQDFPSSADYSVQSLTDLNGDSVLEVVVEFIASESAGAEV